MLSGTAWRVVAAACFMVCSVVWSQAGADAAEGSAPAQVVAYASPPEEPVSEDFELTVAGQSVPVYRCRVSAVPLNQVWPGYQRPEDQTEVASFAYWDMAGPVEVEVVSRRPVESVAIRPTARGIEARVEGNRIRFRLPDPQQITVEVNGWHKALHLFANAPQPPGVDAKTPGVRYFGPGVHRPGKIVLKSNETVLLAGGAVVYGCIEATDAENIHIAGRGILDTSEFERMDGRKSDRTRRQKNVTTAGGCIHLRGCKKVTIDGVILRDPNVWCLSTFACSDVAITNVKLIGLWRYNSDGIDICNSQHVTVRNCFVRSFDDSLVVKGLGLLGQIPIEDVVFEGCVVWNDWGRALEIGAETSAPEIRHIVFRNCDVVRTTHVAVDIQHCDRAAVKDVTFEDIRVEVDEVNHLPRIQKTREETYVDSTDYCPQFLVLVILKSANSHDEQRGTMEDVIVRNCSIRGKPLPPSRIRGFDAEHEIRDVLIANLRINGRVARSLEEARIVAGPFAEDVRIEAP